MQILIRMSEWVESSYKFLKKVHNSTLTQYSLHPVLGKATLACGVVGGYYLAVNLISDLFSIMFSTAEAAHGCLQGKVDISTNKAGFDGIKYVAGEDIAVSGQVTKDTSHAVYQLVNPSDQTVIVEKHVYKDGISHCFVRSENLHIPEEAKPGWLEVKLIAHKNYDMNAVLMDSDVILVTKEK